jgi:hypothetical protein
MSDSKGASKGSADAFEHFRIGKKIPFEDCRTGDFINFSRQSGSGHAVVFCHYCDKDGNETDVYSSDVIGFYYISSQTGGIGYRIGIWKRKETVKFKPKFPVDSRIFRDKYLFCGRLFNPLDWNVGKDVKIPNRY